MNDTTNALDVVSLRRDFPALAQEVHGKPLAYLDNAATTHKPRAVIDAIAQYYEHDCANVHRAVHTLSERATHAYEGARHTLQRFINAASPDEIVFVRGTTEAINLVAQTQGRETLREGDEVVVSAIEHHSNIVPWQLICAATGARLRVAPVNDAGELDLAALESCLCERTRVVALTHVSNALGTINPVREVVQLAHAHGALVLLDGAQAVPHLAVDVRALDCDFYAFSGHKMYGPTGIGVLYGKLALLEKLPPYQGGGDMIRSVTFERTLYAKPPYRFEAGTPHIAGAIGLAAAANYLTGVGLERIAHYEAALLAKATAALIEIPGVRLIGTAQHKASVLSFVHDEIHPHDLGTILDGEGVAIRTGHHCAEPAMRRFGVPATARASFSFYNDERDIAALVRGMHRAREVFGA